MAVVEGKKSAIRAIAKLERTELALNYRRSGLSYRAIAAKIAEELGLPKYSPQAAHRDVTERLTELNRSLCHSAEELRALELERLDVLLNALDPAIGLGDTKSIAQAVRISERRSKLLGLDAPIEVRLQAQAEAIATAEFTVLLERLAANPEFPQSALDILLREAEALGDRAALAEAN